MNNLNKKTTLFQRIRKTLWSGEIFNTRNRLAFGQCLMVASLTIAAGSIGLLPDTNQPIMDARKLQAETLALTGSSLAQANPEFIANFEHTLSNSLHRADGLISIGLRDQHGDLPIDIGNHTENWNLPENKKSTDQFMFVPIVRDGQQVGQLELCFEPLTGVGPWLTSYVAQFAGLAAMITFLGFNFILHRTLSELDPRGAIPRRVREAFDTMAEGLLIVDRKSRIMLANSRFGELVGVNGDRLVGMSVDVFEWQTDASNSPWDHSIETGEATTETTLQLRDADGIERTFICSAAPIYGHEGQVGGAMITLDDITSLEEHKRELVAARKAADEANQAKSTFLSRMSHEIRTPMNSIIGYTEILRSGVGGSQEQQSYLGTIQNSGEHLLALINDILDLSKIEAGQMTVERRNVEFAPILHHVLETLKGKADEKSLHLQLLPESRLPRQINTDETRLRQILVNIIGNAIKFTESGSVSLNCSLHPATKHIVLNVVDTGVGIPKKALANIFDPFTQADDSITRKFGGTGLGLSISKQLSEALGGGIAVDSEEGIGTTFSITIDPGQLAEVDWLEPQEVLEAKTVEQIAVTELPSFTGTHLLVVDDTKPNRDLMGVMLKRIGVTCDFAIHGLDAIEKIADRGIDHPYDVVLMDMSMPVMDGEEATKKLRESNYLHPIVALTAMVLDEERERCLSFGCDSFLSKPIRMNELIDTLGKFVSTCEPGITNINTNETNQPIILPQGDTFPSLQDNSKISLDDTGTVNHQDIEDDIEKTLASLGIQTRALTEVQPKPDKKNQFQESYPVPEVVASAFSEDPDFAPIVADFAKRLQDRVGEFRAEIEKDDTGPLRKLGHWLAGAAGTVALEELVGPAREIEYGDYDRARLEYLIDTIEKLTSRLSVPEARTSVS